MSFVHPAPQIPDLIARLGAEKVIAAITADLSDKEASTAAEWTHWDKLRHLPPPGGLSHEQWWFTIKQARAGTLRPLPLTDPDTGSPFRYAMPDGVLRLLHLVDQHCAGEIAMPQNILSDDQARQHYLINSVMEEAIRSSQLEGATTSRRRAVEMLRTGRPPKDRSEQMILNNYRALEFMRGMGDTLTPALVLELHRVVTEKTLDNPDAAGRLQRADEDRVAVYDIADGSLIHRPPPAELLPERLELLCAFANGESDGESFVHPVVRALLLHFWIGYDHPFEDGNGRTARALFYWSMRESGYWLTEYLSISRILRRAPVQYSNSFVYSETDGGDTTYFLLYQLSVIERALLDLHAYLERKVREIRSVESEIKADGSLNHRQLALLGDALRTAGRRYTYRSHAVSHGVTHETARSDLTRLLELGYLSMEREGRQHVFRAAVGLAKRMRAKERPPEADSGFDGRVELI
ncbi:MAG: Fic family protein [Thermoleophilia bacterium]